MEWSRRAPQTAPHKIVFVRHKKQANCSFSFGATKCPRKWFRNKCSQSPPRSYSNLRRSILILYSKYKQNMFSARNVYVNCSCSQLLFKQSAVEKKTESRWEIVINFNMKHENSESQLVFACIECCDLGKGVCKKPPFGKWFKVIKMNGASNTKVCYNCNCLNAATRKFRVLLLKGN